MIPILTNRHKEAFLMDERKRLVVTISPELYRAVRHTAIDSGMTLRGFIESVLRENVTGAPVAINNKSAKRAMPQYPY